MAAIFRYSMIVTGAIDEVKAIFKKYRVPLIPGDFAPGIGYLFDVKESGAGQSELVKELEANTNVVALSTHYSVKPDKSFLKRIRNR